MNAYLFSCMSDVAMYTFVLNGLYMGYQSIASLCYKNLPNVSNNELPSISVLVPAYNESQQAAITLESIYCQSNYPKDKLEIIAINDGSKDDTAEWITRSVTKYPAIKFINNSVNMGKRHALYDGIVQSSNEIIISVDSDTNVEENTLRNLVIPFINNDKVGAVAGNIKVLNINEGIIPKLMQISFSFSFDFIRASQSVTDSLYICPGALSAFRKSYMTNFLEDWRDETFMGTPAKIGEDSSLTIKFIQDGYDVKFAKNSIAYTSVPTEYPKLKNMLLRWGRSGVRNLITLAPVFINTNIFSKLGLKINIAMTFLNSVITPFICMAYIMGLFIGNFHIDSILSMGLLLVATAPALIYIVNRTKGEALSNAMYSYVYTIYYTLFLSWIPIWALITVKNSGWLTRNKK